VTVIPTSSSEPIDAAWLQEYIDCCLRDDDIFRLEVLAGIVLVGPLSQGKKSTQEVHSLLQTWGTEWVEFVANEGNLRPGPHLIVGKALWRVFRLCDDVQNTFLIIVRGPNMEG